MSEREVSGLLFAILLGAGCGPAVRDPVSVDESSGGSGSSSTAMTSETTASSSGESDPSSGSGPPSMCDGWIRPDEPGWSLQNCATEPCPEGEVCRYDPSRGCDSDPICIDPSTYACDCELYGESVFVACACPGYKGPLNGDFRAILECNTGLSRWPVAYDICGV